MSEQQAEYRTVYGSTELETYTAIKIMVEAFQTANQSILDDYVSLQKSLAVAEDCLKARARILGGELNDYYTITVQSKTRKWFDADIILKLAPYVKDMPGVMAVDRDRIAQLAKAGAIAEDVVKAACKEEPMTSAVTIKAKQL
jgi:hypothetical protein